MNLEEYPELIKEIDVVELHNVQNEVKLIDVREDYEWQHGFIANAIHIPLNKITTNINDVIPDKNTTLVIYCARGLRSAYAAHTLEQMGYTNVSSLQGGIISWQNQGYETIA